MNVDELITLINLESNEILDDSDEYIPYINAAVDYLSFALANVKDPEVCRTLAVQQGDTVPSDFIAFIPKDGYPISIDSGSFTVYVPGSVQVYYAHRKNHVQHKDDLVPFSEPYISALVQLVSFLVKKKSLMVDYANFDKGYISDLLTNVQSARGG